MNKPMALIDMIEKVAEENDELKTQNAELKTRIDNVENVVLQTQLSTEYLACLAELNLLAEA